MNRRHTRIPVLVTVLLLVSALSPFPARAETVELPAARDNTLFAITADTLSSNGIGPNFFAGLNNLGSARRGLLLFDIAAAIPGGSVVDSVELRLRMSQAPSATLRTIAVHRAGADWGEGASSSAGGLGATPAPGDATWLHTFFPGQFWTSQGGDFVAAVSASTPVGGVGFYSWKGPAMAGDVQAWLDQPATNFGWVLLGDETVSQTVKRFDSRENTTSANRPVLIVHYSTSIPTRPSTWSGIKTR